MANHKQAAKGLLELIEINEDETTDPHVLAAMAQTHALLAIVEAIQGIKNSR
jgi:hypothetical protein